MIWPLILLFFTFSYPVSAQETTATPSATLTPSESIAPTPTIVINPNGGIFINEFMPAPDDNQEWVELYNSYDYPVKIENWKFDDIAEGGGAVKELGTLTFTAKEIKIIDLGSSYLNNGDDWARLINNSNQLMDLYHYQSVVTAQSWSKINGTWCLTTPSKNSSNNPCPSPTSNPSPTSAPSATNAPTPNSSSTPSPRPTSTPTPYPTITMAPLETPFNEPLPTDSEEIEKSTDGETLGIQDIIKPTTSPTKKSDFKFPTQVLPAVFIFLGGGLLLTPLIVSKIKK